MQKGIKDKPRGMYIQLQPSHLVIFFIWVVTEQSACGNLWLELKKLARRTGKRGSEERATLVLY